MDGMVGVGWGQKNRKNGEDLGEKELLTQSRWALEQGLWVLLHWPGVPNMLRISWRACQITWCWTLFPEFLI